jgi:hypothetical protein
MSSAPRACWLERTDSAARRSQWIVFSLAVLAARTSNFAFSGSVMNCTSETALIELRVARAYVKLSCIPEDSSEASVSLASIGNCEIRMFRAREADFDGMSLFWLELRDHGANTSVDSFKCHKIKDAVPVLEDFMSQAADLNKPERDGAEGQ